MPEAEFEVMQIVWSQFPPISSISVTGLQHKWKHQTVLTLLTRLTKRGYLSSEKLGKDRFYTPTVSQEDYLAMETGYFMRKFHQNSLTGLMSALYSDKRPSDEELQKMEDWLLAKKQKDEDGHARDIP
ncbi:MAG: BlaI/MecI/CopY family transcriptional regulator [Oscillospiraceae bacterium]|nr:BlaI/MecI/CopY family transcriptional regulator [Oscillospiraceae bacterium]